jgi:transposase-like protein
MKKGSSRRKFTAEFKSKVAFDALKERMTLSELSKHHEVSPNLIMQWKKTLLENGFRIFQESQSHQKDDRKELIELLYREIGYLTMDVSILKKKLSYFDKTA